MRQPDIHKTFLLDQIGVIRRRMSELQAEISTEGILHSGNIRVLMLAAFELHYLSGLLPTLLRQYLVDEPELLEDFDQRIFELQLKELLLEKLGR